MKTLFGISILASVSFGATPCSMPHLESDSLTPVVLDEIRWRSYWFGVSAFGSPAGPGVTLLHGGGYVGYCVEAWDRCAIFAKIVGSQIVYEADASRFVPEKASGVWPIKTGGSTVRRSDPSPDDASHKLSVGGRGISDPVPNPESLAKPPRTEALELRTCTLGASLLGSMVPDAIRQHKRPRKVSSLLRSIKKQGLAQRARRIVVPYFADSDSGVFIKLEKSSGESETLLVIQRDEGWWSFRPIQEIGMPKALANIAIQIDRASMVTLMANGEEVWTH